jgi:hypothetical protein
MMEAPGSVEYGGILLIRKTKDTMGFGTKKAVCWSSTSEERRDPLDISLLRLGFRKKPAMTSGGRSEGHDFAAIPASRRLAHIGEPTPVAVAGAGVPVARRLGGSRAPGPAWAGIGPRRPGPSSPALRDTPHCPSFLFPQACICREAHLSIAPGELGLLGND